MITILFWNLAKQQQVMSHLKCLGQAHSIDVFLLAESPKNLKPAIRDLNSLSVGTYREADYVRPRVRAITRFAAQDFVHRYTSVGREMAVWSFVSALPSSPEILLGFYCMKRSMNSVSARRRSRVRVTMDCNCAAAALLTQ